MDFVVKQVRIVMENEVVSGSVRVRGGRIDKIYADMSEEAAELPVIDGRGGWLLPGFVDVHVHGGYGADVMDASTDALRTMCRFHGRHGTTSLLATTVTASREALEAVLACVERYMREDVVDGCEIAGVHLEGPFISPKWPGAQNPAFIVLPKQEWLEDWLSRYPGVVRLLTLAPEREGATDLIRWLSARGVTVAAGHTDAGYQQMLDAADAGLSHAVHTFNAMKGLHHREPGVVGAILTDERIAAEVIADGHHVHEAAIRLLVEAKRRNGSLLLITDAMSAAGLGDGEYELGGLRVTVADGVARLVEGGSLAGSTLTMIDAFRYMVRRIGLSVPEASRLASLNPARAVGLSDRIGSIAVGRQADLLLVSDELELEAVWSRGVRIWHRLP